MISCIKFCDGLDLNLSQDNSPDQSVNPKVQKELSRHSTMNLENKKTELFIRKFKSFNLSKNDSNISSNLRIYLQSQNKFRFILPIITHPEIANVKMRDLVQTFRNELLVYDLEKANGIVFNLPDIIQCGMFGICGIAKSKQEILKMFEKSVNLLKDIVTKKEYKTSSLSIEKRTDIIEVMDLIGTIKYFVKNGK